MKKIKDHLTKFLLCFLCMFFSFTVDAEIKAIIFDCDGTLVDSEEVQYKIWESAFALQGYDLTREEYIAIMTKHVLSGNTNAQRLFARLGAEMIGRDCEEELMRDMSLFGKDYKKPFPVIESTVDFLHQVYRDKQRLGLKLGLASGAPRAMILRHLKDLGVEEYFDVILSGREDLEEYDDAQGKNKPKPYVYMHAAKLLGLSPAECIAIEDSRTGVTSAVDAGCLTIAIPNEYTAHHDLSHAHIKLISLKDMSPEALLGFFSN